jgi:glucosamine-6-phosphate deaminase
VTQDPTVVVLSDADVVGNAAADIVAATVRANPRAVIAVPTGTTPLPMFAALIDRVTRGELDLSQIHLFCLDEYVGVAPSEPNSLTGWLTRVFIEPAGISMRNVHTLPSTDEDLAGAPGRYEADLAAHGGLDLATQAMTIGVQTLLEARQIVLLVTGAAKTDILAKTLHAPMSDDVPASWLRLAGERVTVLADEAATGR